MFKFKVWGAKYGGAKNEGAKSGSDYPLGKVGKCLGPTKVRSLRKSLKRPTKLSEDLFLVLYLFNIISIHFLQIFTKKDLRIKFCLRPTTTIIRACAKYRNTKCWGAKCEAQSMGAQSVGVQSE